MNSPKRSPRDELSDRLPQFVQSFITWLSGIPCRDQRQTFKMSPAIVFLVGILFITMGFIIIYEAMQQGWLALVPVYILGVSFVASGTRRLDVLIVHQSLHGKVLKDKKGNEALGEILTTLLFLTPYKSNRLEHLGHHRSPCDENDVDVIYLKSACIAGVNNRKALYRQVLKTVFSPVFHFQFTLNRLKSNLISATPWYRLFMSWTYVFLLLSPALLFGPSYFFSLLLYWLIPLSVGFQMSNFLYTATEHRWWLFNNEFVIGNEKRDQLTFARICCNEAPSRTTLLSWAVWWIYAIFINMPVRLFIIVGDTLQHDLHHVAPNCDWANSTFERQSYQQRTPDRFAEVWGGITAHLCEGNIQKIYENK